MMRIVVALVVVLLAGLLAAAPSSLAQSVVIDDGDCDDITAQRATDNLYGENSALNCSRALAATHTLVYQPDVIRNVVVRRLLLPLYFPDLDIEPAGLSFDSEAAARAALAGGGSFHIVPTAGTDSAAAPVRNWNVWADGKASWIDPGDIPAPIDGDLQNLSVGLDYKLTDRIVLGLLGSFERSDLDTTGTVLSTTRTDGLGGGAYVGITLSDHLVFSAMLTGAHLSTDSTFFAAVSDFDSDRLQASAGVTGYWYFGTTRLMPSVTLAWSREWQDEFVDSLGFLSPEQTLSTAVLTLGNQLGHTFSLGEGTSLEPWVGAQFDWTFVNEVDTDGFPAYDLNDAYDLRIQAGLNFNLAPNAQFSLTGEVGGLLMPDNDIYSGQANLAVQF
jgi:hypothetical protein